MSQAQLMRAVVYRGPRAVEVTEIPQPPLGDHEVRVRVAYCGVCGTDLHIMFGDGDWGQPGSVYGHEWSGDIVEVGTSVDRWSIGDRVVGGDRTCGECGACRSGRPSLCRSQQLPSGPTYGGFAEYIVQHQDAVFEVKDGLELRTAALAEPLAVALHGVTRSGAGPSDRVLVTGGGPIGQLTVAALISRGITDIVVSEPLATRRGQAERLGAVAVPPSELGSIEHYMQVVSDPFDAAIECSGSVAATEQAFGQLGPGGRLVIVGTNFAPITVQPLRILVQEAEIVGARQYDEGGLDDAVSLLRSEAISWSELVEPEDTVFARFEPLLASMHRGEVARKPMVVSG